MIKDNLRYFSIKLCCGYSLESPRNICCGYSLESPQRGDSYEYPQHMFLWHKVILMSTPQHMMRGDSNEYPQHMMRGDSNEYPQHMFLWRTRENYPSIITKYPPYLFHCLHQMTDFQ